MMLKRLIRHYRLDLSGRLPIAGAAGLTLVELLVAVIILGIIASLAIGQSLSILRREKINSVALALAGWIEEVRNLSMKEVTSTPTAGGCVITFVAGASAISGGTSFASVPTVTVNNTSCAPRDNGTTSVGGQFLLPRNLGATVTTGFEQTGLSGAPTITYSPRGMWLAKTGASGDLTIKLFLDGGGPMRCLRVSATLAFVDIGSLSTTDSSTSCAGASYVRF